MKAISVIGSNFGDEGKGLMTDYFSSNNCLVVRFNGGCQAGHCQSGDSLIFTIEGLFYLKDIVGSETNNNTCKLINMDLESESTSLLYRKNNVVYNFIKLSNGVEFKCTNEHKFYVWDSRINKRCWVESVNLNKNFHQFIFPKEYNSYDGKEPKINDIISKTDYVHNKIKIDTSKINFCDLAEFFGLCNGDGNFSKKGIKLYLHIKENDIIKWCKNFAKNLGIKYNTKLHCESNKCIVFNMYSVEFIEILKKLGCFLGKLEYKKTPMFVMNGTKNIISSYLRGLFDSDGTIVFNKNKYRNARIKFSNCSKDMVKEAQQLLYLIGINSYFSENLPSKKRPNNKKQYLLDICSFDDLVSFRNKINFRNKYKKNKLNNVINFRKSINKNLRGFKVLVSNKIQIHKLCKKTGRQTKKILSGFVNSYYNKLLNTDFQDLAIICKNYHIIDIDNIIFNHGICDVFDVTMPKTHSYIANGTISHNTVCDPTGKRHVFSHFGSGSIKGAATYLSSYFIFNPLLWFKELNVLKSLKIFPEVFYDLSGIMTLPYDMLINQELERSRGNNKHGSCGHGINETVTRHQRGFSTTIGSSNYKNQKSYYKYLRDSYFKQRIEELDIKLNNDILDIWNSEKLLDHFIESQLNFNKKSIPTSDKDCINDITCNNIVFEGAQGLLLDEDHTFFPHVTRSKTGLCNVVSLCKAFGISDIQTVYTTRSYFTRHGAGPFPSENISLKYDDNTNNPNEFQGSLRFGHFDIDLFSETVKKDLHANNKEINIKPCISVTHMDQVEEYMEILMDGRITRILSNELNYILEEKTGIKVKYLSYGPTREDIIEIN